MKKFLILAVLFLGVQTLQAEDFPKLKILNYASPSMSGYDHEIWRWNYVRSRVANLAELQYKEAYNDDYAARLLALSAEGNLPDLFTLWPAGKTDFIYDKKLARDLRPLLDEALLKNFLPPAVNSRFQKGNYLAVLPISVSYSPVVFVNSAVLNSLGLKPAQTAEELSAQIPLMKKAGLEAVLWVSKEQEGAPNELFSLVCARLAGESFIDDVLAGKAKFTQQSFIDALKTFQSLTKDMSAVTATEALAQFAAGKSAYLVGNGSLLAAMVSDKKKAVTALIPVKDQGKILILTFPRLAGQKEGAPEAVCRLGPGFALSASIEAGSKREAAALEVIKSLSSVFAQDDRLRTRFAYPSRIDVPAPKDFEPLELSYLKWTRAVPSCTNLLSEELPPGLNAELNNGLTKLLQGTAKAEDISQKLQKLLASPR